MAEILITSARPSPRKLAIGQVNGHDVTFFAPPHDEPDFPWVDAMELAKAFLARGAARAMLKSTQRFEDGKSVVTIRDGDRLTTIMCHAMGQGLCGAIDEMHGHKGDDGPAHQAYCACAGRIAAEHWPMKIDQIFEAFHNQGGPFLRGGKE